jgi:hypothetical protein
LITYINKFSPHEVKDYDIIYLYLFTLELIKKYYINPNKIMIEKVNEFKTNLSFFSNYYSSDFKKFTNSLKVYQSIKSSKIQPNTSLAIKTIDLFLDIILNNNEKQNNYKNDDLFVDIKYLKNLKYEILTKNQKFNNIIKLKENKLFKDFEEYFIFISSCDIYNTDDLYHSISLIFPLIKYLNFNNDLNNNIDADIINKISFEDDEDDVFILNKFE